MDAGDYIYIVIAIVLAIVNAVANKKKKDAAKKKAAEVEADSEMPQRDPAELLQEILLGKTEIFTPQQKPVEASTNAEFDDEEEFFEENVELDDKKSYWSYEAKEELSKSIEYEQPFEEVKEEKLYSKLEYAPLDTPENSKFTPVDTYALNEEAIGDYQYDPIAQFEESDKEMSDMIFDHENALMNAERSNALIEEFEARKAVLYSEILRPKYI